MFDIKWYGEKIVSGESCESIVSSLVDKVKQDTSNATVFLSEESAHLQAMESDKYFAEKKNRKLEWVPFSVKDLFLQNGQKATACSMMLHNYESSYTATVLDRLQKEGAILLLRDNCDMFWHGNTNENSYYWPAKNAKDPSKVAWGSSGWTAVNVAKWNVVFWIGSDTWWSIRQPAVLNGVVGFKPTYGKISRYWLMSYASSLDTVGIVANRVWDVVKILNVVWGKDEKDFTTIDHVILSEEVLNNFQIEWKKIAYYKQFLEYEWLSADIKNNILSTLDILKSKWADVVELDFFPADLLVSTYYTIALAETASNLARLDGVNFWYRSPNAMITEDVYMMSRWEGLSDETKRRVIVWNQVLSQWDGAKLYKKALIARKQIEDKFSKQFEMVDFVISPVVPCGARSLGTDCQLIDWYMSDLYTVWFSLWKLPSLWISTKQGIGFQITGWYNKDNEVLSFGNYLETVL